MPQSLTTGSLLQLVTRLGLLQHIDFLHVTPKAAIANLISQEGVEAFTQALVGRPLPGGTDGEICTVTKAKVQGWQNNTSYYQHASRGPKHCRPYSVDYNQGNSHPQQAWGMVSYQ